MRRTFVPVLIAAFLLYALAACAGDSVELKYAYPSDKTTEAIHPNAATLEWRIMSHTPISKVNILVLTKEDVDSAMLLVAGDALMRGERHPLGDSLGARHYEAPGKEGKLTLPPLPGKTRISWFIQAVAADGRLSGIFGPMHFTTQ